MKDILEYISGAEAQAILKQLCASDTGLRRRVEEMARSQLKDIDPDIIADEVFFQLDTLDVEDVWDGAGPIRDGYAAPDEIAEMMVEGVLGNFISDMERYAKLRMTKEFNKYCMGILLGLYRFELESKNEFLSWATDIPSYHFDQLLNTWRKSCKSKRDHKAMDAFIAKNCPAWASWACED
jgi:hypothetical protein